MSMPSEFQEGRSFPWEKTWYERKIKQKINYIFSSCLSGNKP
uniref:Uncharacterized protein n=1 Tax=uncultured bacterium contig00033 TaxID=1181522 RepID=A0A806KEJ2_9BACT|nr:hypothetical protein [uncultured bacterium contig00033]